MSLSSHQPSNSSFAPGSGQQAGEAPLSAAESLPIQQDLQALSGEELKSTVTAQLRFCHRLAKDIGQPGVNKILDQCDKAPTEPKDPANWEEEDPNADKLLAEVLNACLDEEVSWTTTEILKAVGYLLAAGMFVTGLGGIARQVYSHRRAIQAGADRDDEILGEQDPEESRLLMGPQDQELGDLLRSPQEPEPTARPSSPS
ncbi:hypothetical protein QFC20_006540 [Naganishia adeliensis]|uniref:Uncharacterized protein n=1 Tax=Naganishia adeliensis TaxID=92952 RepID=A0ACC2VB22_9TREE|nr:hypothetical protein QFC20_006540 [Naganishia adeliensis]